MRVIKRLRQKERLSKERISHLIDYASDSPKDRPAQRLALLRSYFTASSRLEELATVQQWFQALINRFSHLSEPPRFTPSFLSGEPFDQLNLALAEGFTNAVRHAHENLPSSTPILIECEIQPHQIEICIFDQGEPFDPDSLIEPQPGTLREGGYGWFLLRRLVDRVTYSPIQKEFLIRRLSETASVHSSSIHSSTDSCMTLRGEDIERVCNCLRLVKKA